MIFFTWIETHTDLHEIECEVNRIHEMSTILLFPGRILIASYLGLPPEPGIREMTLCPFQDSLWSQ